MIPASRYVRMEPDDPSLTSPEFQRREDALFANIVTSRGVWKTTNRNRLAAMTEPFFRVAAAANFRPSVVMDIGVSSGVTTLEWLLEFVRRDIAVEIIATDLSMTAYLADLGGTLGALLEPNGHILQVELLDRGIRTWCSRRDYLLGSCIWKKALNAFVHARLRRAGVVFPLDPAQRDDRARRPLLSGPFSLATPALRGRPEVTLVEDDIRAPNRPDMLAVADVVRIANLLQEGYCTPDEARTIVRNIRERCRGPGSLVVVCRNRKDLEGSILRVAEDGFVVEDRIGAGSEAEHFFTDRARRGAGDLQWQRRA